MSRIQLTQTSVPSTPRAVARWVREPQGLTARWYAPRR
jgi:hypothetical protein